MRQVSKRVKSIRYQLFHCDFLLIVEKFDQLLKRLFYSSFFSIELFLQRNGSGLEAIARSLVKLVRTIELG